MAGITGTLGPWPLRTMMNHLSIRGLFYLLIPIIFICMPPSSVPKGSNNVWLAFNKKFEYFAKSRGTPIRISQDVKKIPR